MVIVPGGGSVRQWLLSGGAVVLDPPTNVSADRIKAAFYYSSQLQTWSQAGRKHVESQLRTCLKLFFSTFHLSNTRMNQRTCCGSRPGFRQKKSKAGRKRVANPHKLVENLAGCKSGRKPGLQPGLQLAKLMECGLKGLNMQTPGRRVCLLCLHGRCSLSWLIR